MILKFSKYKGQKLQDIAKKDPRFAIWYVKKFQYKLEVFEIADEIINIARENMYKYTQLEY